MVLCPSFSEGVSASTPILPPLTMMAIINHHGFSTNIGKDRQNQESSLQSPLMILITNLHFPIAFKFYFSSICSVMRSLDRIVRAATSEAITTSQSTPILWFSDSKNMSSVNFP